MICKTFFVFSLNSVVYASRQIIQKSILFNKFMGTNHRKQTSASILYTLCCMATFSSFFCLCKLLANFKLVFVCYVFFQCLNPALIILCFSCTKLVTEHLINYFRMVFKELSGAAFIGRFFST